MRRGLQQFQRLITSNLREKPTKLQSYPISSYPTAHPPPNMAGQRPPPNSRSGNGSQAHSSSNRKKSATSNSQNPSDPKSKVSKPTPKKPPRDPKQSHLYTDDNPSTTLHGTGFKDSAAAKRTISLVAQRSLTYQWQVVNTMYHRAKGHPAMRKGENVEGMKAAMGVFRTWLDETYPEARERRRAEGREFKPLLAKGVVGKYLERVEGVENGDEDGEVEDCKRFARMYVELGKGKRLANTLLDDAHPEREDWEIRRERALVKLREERVGEGENGLWNEKGGVSDWHLRCIGWAWSPVGEKRLPP